MKKAKSLAASVTGITATVIGAAMLVYAVYQYVTMPGVSAWTLLVEHMWHVLVLGALTYVTMYVLLHKRVVEPIHELHAKLYRIAHGDDTPMEIETNIREIQEVSESVNLMLSQLHRTSHDPWVGKLRDNAHGLRMLSQKKADSPDTSDRELLAHAAVELEELATVIERFEAKAQNLDHDL